MFGHVLVGIASRFYCLQIGLSTEPGAEQVLSTGHRVQLYSEQLQPEATFTPEINGLVCPSESHMPWRGASPAAAWGCRGLSAGWFLWQLLLLAPCRVSAFLLQFLPQLERACRDTVVLQGTQKDRRSCPALAGVQLNSLWSSWFSASGLRRAVLDG